MQRSVVRDFPEGLGKVEPAFWGTLCIVCPNWFRMLSSTSGRLWPAGSVAVAPDSIKQTRT